MKFINLHLKNNDNKKFAVNPMMITAVRPLDEGGSRIYYTLLSQHDDVTEEYDNLMIQINDILEGWL